MQETRVRSLVREDPTHHGATELLLHNSQARALEPRWATAEACGRQSLCFATSHCSEKPASHNWRGAPTQPQLEKSLHSKEDPAQSKINKVILK